MINTRLNHLYNKYFSQNKVIAGTSVIMNMPKSPNRTKNKNHRIIIKGGVVNEDEYHKKPCVVYILAEPNGNEFTPWNWPGSFSKEIKLFSEQSSDLNKDWRDYIKQIGMCTYLLKNKDKRLKKYEDLVDQKQEIGRYAKQAGITNIKKSLRICPPSKMDESLVNKWAKETKELIIEELKIMKPNIIVCYGHCAYRNFKKILGILKDKPYGKHNKLHYCYFNFVGINRLLCIEQFHPAARLGREINYEALCSLIPKI